MEIETEVLKRAIEQEQERLIRREFERVPYLEQSPFVAQGEIDDLLRERAKTHGDFTEHAEITQSLKDIMHVSQNWDRLTNIQKEALEMTAHKIGRILAGDPDVVDHWADIAGYSELVVKRIHI